MMSDLRDSGQIEQDADTILMLLREEYYLRQVEPNDGFRQARALGSPMSACRGVIEFIVPKARRWRWRVSSWALLRVVSGGLVMSARPTINAIPQRCSAGSMAPDA